VLL
jgi:hypothetical protein